VGTADGCEAGGVEAGGGEPGGVEAGGGEPGGVEDEELMIESAFRIVL